jgi:hypothetical protein
MEPGAAFSNPSSGKIDQQRKILEVRTAVADPHRKNAYADPGKKSRMRMRIHALLNYGEPRHFDLSCIRPYQRGGAGPRGGGGRQHCRRKGGVWKTPTAHFQF